MVSACPTLGGPYDRSRRPLVNRVFLFFFAVDDPAPVGETEHGPLKFDMLGSVWTEMSEGKKMNSPLASLARIWETEHGPLVFDMLGSLAAEIGFCLYRND